MSQILAMWCSEGLECVIDITEEQKKAVWAEPTSIGLTLFLTMSVVS